MTRPDNTRISRLCPLLLLAALAGGGACEPLDAAVVGIDVLRAEELRPQLEAKPGPWIVDLRDADSFKKGHIPGARRLNLQQLSGYLSRVQLPRKQLVITVCYHGNQSKEAAAVVAGRGHRRVASLTGGMTRWAQLGYPQAQGPGERLPESLLAPARAVTSALQQWVSFTAGMVLKPIYMIAALILILWLRRSSAADLRLIRWGLCSFLVGEAACAANFFSSEVATDPLEIIHGSGMALMGALVTWGVFRLLDRRVVHLSPPEARCVVQRFCGRCWKRPRKGGETQTLSCGLQRLFLLLAPALALIALMPLSAPLRPLSVVLPVLGSDVPWVKTLVQLLVEFRLFPLLAALLLLWTGLRLWRGGVAALERVQLPFFLGLGLMSFSLMRFFMYAPFFHMPIWGDFWEELTELVAVLSVGLLLWVFRHQLGLSREGARAAAEPAIETPSEHAMRGASG